MIKIRETQKETQTIYLYEIYDEEKLISSNSINYYTYSKSLENNLNYLILYNEDMEVIEEVFDYLNIECIKNSINTRKKSLQALRLLFIFQKIICKNITNFDRNDINNLKYFLRGISPDGLYMSFDLKTIRRNNTINSYLSIYRNYLSYLGNITSFLFDKSNKKTKIFSYYNEKEYEKQSYKSNEKVPKYVRKVPMYISVQEFSKIIDIIRSKYTSREECIVRLMYENGLRIGEVLGLTGDDLIQEQDDNGNYRYSIYIRNRVSDKSYQQAKSCLTVNNKKVYRSSEYKTENYGYQKVNIRKELYDLISNYIEEAHSYAVENKLNNYYKNSIADRVFKSDDPYLMDNYYIFINNQGKCLTQQNWNKKLRQIYELSNIQIDKDKRMHNLNHRFRHGFAMYQVQYLKVNEMQLRERLRHRYVTSVLVYFRPTEDDEIELKTSYSNDLYKVIPKLTYIKSA